MLFRSRTRILYVNIVVSNKKSMKQRENSPKKNNGGRGDKTDGEGENKGGGGKNEVLET